MTIMTFHRLTLYSAKSHNSHKKSAAKKNTQPSCYFTSS